MPKYLCLQRSLPATESSHEKPSRGEMEAMYAKFMAWRERFKDQITDMGGRLGKGSVVADRPLSDGPFVEVKELVGGYMIVTADNIEEAGKIARECPGLVGPTSAVEVVEILAPG